MAKNYLIYDADCPTCVRLASTVQSTVNEQLTLLSIHSEAAHNLLDKAYPNGWQPAPYLVRVTPRHTRAWDGFQMSARLGWSMGPRKALQTLLHMRRDLGGLRAALLTVRAPIKALACDPCARPGCGRCVGCQNPCGLKCC